VIQPHSTRNFLIFGSHGTLGEAIFNDISKMENCYRGSRDLNDKTYISKETPKFNGVIWAQGINGSETLSNFDAINLQSYLDVNTLFIANTLRILLDGGKLANPSQLVILSSVWSDLARPAKMGYSISKAATNALMRSLSIDLAPNNIFVNSISPGVIDTPMTRQNLTNEEINRVINETPSKKLVTIHEIVEVVKTIAFGQMPGMNGQNIIVDGGWAVSKLV